MSDNVIDINNIVERVRKYCLSHPDLMEKGFIKGVTPGGKVGIGKGEMTKEISIDDLELDLFDFETFEYKGNQRVVSINSIKKEDEEVIEQLDEQDIVNDNKKVPTTLEEMKNCVASKNEDLIDKALQTFAIDEKTGNISVQKAIITITDNSINNVVNCVRDNKELSTDLSNYDIKGNQIVEGESLSEAANIEKMIDDSFNNIMIYVEVAKLKNIIYNVNQIESAKNKYSTSVKDKLNVLGLVKDKTPEPSKKVTLGLKPDNDIKKAGFADILILTVIILIYAAIIINLITKLK